MQLLNSHLHITKNHIKIVRFFFIATNVVNDIGASTKKSKNIYFLTFISVFII